MPDNGDPRLPLHVLSNHPLLPPLIKQALSASRDRRLISRLTYPDPTSAPPHLRPCVFVLDVWSLGDQIIGACRLLRIRHPGSKFVALMTSGKNDRDEELRLLYAGFDGSVKATDKWCDELAEAIEVILSGRLWFPGGIISEYVKHTNLLLDDHLSRSLTARENQVLQLVVRRLSNKEIGGALGISERTVRFHVSRVFIKLRIENRTGLFKSINIASTAHHAS